MAKALDEVLPLRQIDTLNEAGQASDALLEAGCVERVGGGMSVDIRAIMEPCDGHMGSPGSQHRGDTVARVSVTTC